jgi:hypothetical protein
MRATLLCAVAAALALAGAGCGDPDFAGAPDVRGLNLDDADTALEQAGYRSTITDNDGLFGIVIRSNFAVCDQSDTRGKLVPLEVAKHGC